MYDNLQEKYKNSVSQILKIRKIKTLERLAILILLRQLGKKYIGLCNSFGNKVIERFSFTSHTEHPN